MAESSAALRHQNFVGLPTSRLFTLALHRDPIPCAVRGVNRMSPGVKKKLCSKDYLGSVWRKVNQRKG
jgi:hypothetical protein